MNVLFHWVTLSDVAESKLAVYNNPKIELLQMNNGSKDVLGVVKKTLIKVLEAYSSNTYDYLYEEDIRAELTSELKKAFKDDPLQDAISKVKTEYVSRLDIAILKAPTVPLALSDNKGLMSLYKQQIEVGIEIKLRPFDGDKIGDFRSDQRKLQALVDSNEPLKSVDTGIAIICYMTEVDFERERVTYYKTYDAWKEQSLIKGKVNCIAASPSGLFIMNEIG